MKNQLLNPFAVRKYALLGFVMLLTSLVAVLEVSNFNFASAAVSGGRDYSTNSIMNGGALSTQEFVSKIGSSTTGDLPSIYANYGLQAYEYARLIRDGRAGVAYKDGRIMVGDRVVATGGKSLGRAQKSYSQVRMVGNVPFHESSSTNVFASNTINATVLLNEKGEFEFAYLNACGNPIDGNPNNPSSACNMLNVRVVDRNTRCYTTNVTATNGSTLRHIEYNFGDGVTQAEANAGKEVCHTYQRAGSYTAHARAVFNVPGPNGTYVIEATGNCTKPIVIEEAPVYLCTLIVVTSLNAPLNTKFRVTTQYSARKATLNNAKYSLDKTTAVTVLPAASGVVAKDYDLDDGKKHTVDVTLTFSIGLTAKQVSCSAAITAGKKPMCTVPGKEQYEPNAPECFKPCEYVPTIPVDSPECLPPIVPVTPTTPETPLPKTGPGEVGAMFAGLAAVGAGFHYLMKRRSDKLNGLAVATTSDDPSVLDEFIAQQHISHEEAVIAHEQYKHLHPTYSKRGSHHRLISKFRRK